MGSAQAEARHVLRRHAPALRHRPGLLGDPKLIIVDEPTADLDPEERNRFLNLLAEIGEKVVVILSTRRGRHRPPTAHDDHRARPGAVGRANDTIAALTGRVWRREVPKAALEEYRQRLVVLSTRLVGGRTIVHVPVPPDAHPGVPWLRDLRAELRLTVTVDEEPYGAGIDPYNKLIDRVSEDNPKRVALQ